MPSLWVGKQDSWISSLPCIANDLVFVTDRNRMVFLCVLWHIAGSAIMTMCMESLWGLLCGNRSCACLLCPFFPGTWYAVGTQLICVQGIEELDSDHLVSLFFSVWSINSHPRGTHSLQLLWSGLPNFTSEIFLLLSDHSSQSGNFTSMSHKATHTVNLRLLSIPLCLGLVPPRFFPDVECFQVVYQTL